MSNPDTPTLAPASRHPPATWPVVGPLLGLIAAFSLHLWPEWWQNPDLSHALFAPLVFGLLIWESRRQGPARWLPGNPWTTGGVALLGLLGLALFAAAGLLAAAVTWNHALVNFVLAAALGGFLLGGLLILADTRVRLVPWNWISLTAVFLWLLASPLPSGTYARLTLGLQGWVTGAVLHSLHLLGIPARQHGNLIELANHVVGIEEACSGIRSLLSCVYAGFFFAAWQVRRPGARLVLIIAAPVLALSMNFVRSLVLTLLVNAGKDITGPWHDFTGYAILGLTAAILAGLAMLLESPPTLAALPTAPTATRRPRWSVGFFVGAQILTIALGVFFYTQSRPAENTAKPIPDLAALLPTQAHGWEVQTDPNLYRFSDVLQTSHLLERTYLRSGGDGQLTQLTVYLAYWPAGQTTVSRVASHTPDACWPGAGWSALPVADLRETPQWPGLVLARAEHRRFQSTGGFNQNVWFWQIHDGRAIDYRDPYSVPALLQLALQYGFRRQGDQYFIRISSNRPWAELSTEPLVGEILGHLASIGL